MCFLDMPALAPLLQALAINRTAFRAAHSEWKKLQVETRMFVAQLNDLVCPACLLGARALHGDGNQKLFTWARGREALIEAYYKGVLFACSDLVARDMKVVSKILGTEVSTPMGMPEASLQQPYNVAHTRALHAVQHQYKG